MSTTKELHTASFAECGRSIMGRRQLAQPVTFAAEPRHGVG